METHDGSVTVYSQPGEGTVFRPTQTLIMARILLIDDDDSVRTMLHLTLAHFGHTVIEARNGKEGLELFQHALAPVASLPVREVISGVHIKSDLTLGLGEVVHDYLVR